MLMRLLKTGARFRRQRPNKTFRRTGGFTRASRNNHRPLPVATYAVGDIHGCLDLLRRLLDGAGFDGGRDKLWIVGDVVNRGGQSLETLRWLHDNRAAITLVLGNHDIHLLAARTGAVKLRDGDTTGATMKAILRADDGDELLEWLRKMPLAHRQGGYLMVHAGVLPMWDANDVMRLADEVSAVIGGERWGEFAESLYGDTPDNWSPSLQGCHRWRVIVNALTRLRVCADDGTMLLKFSGKPEAAPPGFRPWFEAKGRKTSAATIICGHWAALGFVRRPGLLALDTGAAWGGGLTAVRLDDGEVFYCPAGDNNDNDDNNNNNVRNLSGGGEGINRYAG